MSCLCLLDLSAAFDTIDRSILLTRLLSWFSIHGSVLNWFKSSRYFRVRCNNTFSSFYTSSCGVPKALFSVLCLSSCTLPPQHSHLLRFPSPSPLCRRHPTVLLILPTQLRLKYHAPANCPSANLLLADCQSPNSPSLQD